MSHQTVLEPRGSQKPWADIRTSIARIVYTMRPATFYDKVDGDCTMPWQQAVIDAPKRVDKAYRISDRILELFLFPSNDDKREAARRVLASCVTPSWQEGILSGKNTDWGHIKPTEAIRAMIVFSQIMALQPKAEEPLLGDLEGIVRTIFGEDADWVNETSSRDIIQEVAPAEDLEKKGYEQALKDVVEMMKISPHLVQPIFIPAVEGLAVTRTSSIEIQG